MVRSILLSLVVGTVGCAGRAPEPTEVPVEVASPGEARTPKLVVYLVVDQLPTRLLDSVRPKLTGGFVRLTGDSAYDGVARYPYAITFTCPGHATLSTGAPPSVSGLPSNNWYMDGKEVYCAEDLGYLRAEPLADRVVAAGGRVAALSIKDRGALLLGGHSPALVAWFDNAAFHFSGPRDDDGWIEDAVDFKPYLARPWEAMYPEYYASKVPDRQAVEGPLDDPAIVFPKPPLGEQGKGAFRATPFAGSALTDAAIATIDHLELGRKGTGPDLLTVSYSEVDYIGHTYTSESWEAMDGMLRLDADLGRLFAHLDETLGADGWTALLSSDHGSIPGDSVRHDRQEVLALARGALDELGIEGQLLVSDPAIWLPAELEGERRAQAARAVADAITTHPGVARAYAWRTEGGLPAGDPYAEAVRLSVDPERSGDIYVLVEKGHVFDYPNRSGHGTTHGTPHAYDQEVPLLAWGVGVSPAEHPAVADVRQIAPTVSALLGVPKPKDAALEPVDALLED